MCSLARAIKDVTFWQDQRGRIRSILLAAMTRTSRASFLQTNRWHSTLPDSFAAPAARDDDATSAADTVEQSHLSTRFDLEIYSKTA